MIKFNNLVLFHHTNIVILLQSCAGWTKTFKNTEINTKEETQLRAFNE